MTRFLIRYTVGPLESYFFVSELELVRLRKELTESESVEVISETHESNE